MEENILVEVLPDPLDARRYATFVGDSGAGALVTFDGVTRDTFQGRRVLRLEYEAYVPMVRASIPYFTLLKFYIFIYIFLPDTYDKINMSGLRRRAS